MRLIYKILILTISLSTITATAFGHPEEGLSFRSYESIQDVRSSLVIPHSGAKFKLKDYFSISFDFKRREGADPFGYVLRVLIGTQTSIDIMMNNPVRKDPFVCVINEGEMLGEIHKSNLINLKEWNRISLEFITTHDGLTVIENNEKIAQGLTLPKERDIKLIFGACGEIGFITTDVAPFIIKNLSIGYAPQKTKYHWSLDNSYKSDVIWDESGRVSAKVENPVWTIDSHIYWDKIYSFETKGKVFPVVSQHTEELFFIGSDIVYKFNANSRTVKEYPFSPPFDATRYSDQFIYDHYQNALLSYDLEHPTDNVVSQFDFQNGKWSITLERNRGSNILHHSKFISPIDSSIVQFFGYGFHQYKSDLIRIKQNGEIDSATLAPIIAPRYLSAVGIKDSVAYIYGGLGNELGVQEYGIHFFNDLYRLNLNDYSVIKLWGDNRTIEPGDEVAASTLIIDDEKKYAQSLFFNPSSHNSYLVLKEIDIKSGQITPLADTIQYLFRDTESDADLLYVKSQEQLYATTVFKNDENRFEVSIYTISTPVYPLPKSIEKASDTGVQLYAIIIVLVSITGVAIYFLTKKESIKRVTKKTSSTIELSELTTDQNKKPGIYLLNGFQIIDKNNQNITDEFTPTMRQLLSLIILYSHPEGKGVSNARLKTLLWYDKSEDSARNNRSVQISKIRVILEQVGDFTITTANSYWVLQLGEDSFCDYAYAARAIGKLRNTTTITPRHITALLEIASWGRLLPNMNFDWLNTFKSNYADSIVYLLGQYRNSDIVKDDAKTIILLSDGVLIFDSLDENSVRAKCQALVALKRIGTAYETFDRFIAEYERILNRKYKKSFNQFIQE